MSSPLLSVVLPNYNHGAYIERAIQAIISQSRPPDEFIILDDGSTDNSVEIIQTYAKKYAYIHFVQNAQNTGAVAAMQKAFSLVTGDYFYGAAADDYVLPGFFEKALDIAAHYPEAGIIFGKMLVVDPTGQQKSLIGVPSWKNAFFATPKIFLKEYLTIEPPNHALGASTIYRRMCFQEIGGFRQELSSWCDAFAVRAIALQYGACYLPVPLSVWTYISDSVSNSTAQAPQQMLDIIARATWLMRSPDFRDRFPEEYIVHWETQYRQLIINTYMAEFTNSIHRFQSIYHKGLSNNARLDRYISNAYLKWSRLEQRIWTRYLKSSLYRYKGDISCYQNNDNRI